MRSLLARHLLLILGGLAGAPAAQETTPARSEAVSTLRSLRAADHPPVATLAPAFANTTSGQAWFLFDVLESGVVPDVGEGSQLLSAVQRALVLESFTVRGRAAVLAELEQRLRRAASTAERRAAMHVWGAIGAADDLEALLELARPTGDQTPPPRYRDVVRSAVASLLGRDKRGFEPLGRLWEECSDGVLLGLVEAIGDVRDPAGLELLVKVLSWRPALAAATLAQVRKIGPSPDERFNDELVLVLRAQLDAEDPAHTRVLVEALVALNDLESVEPLIEFLEHEDDGLRRTAHWGLRELTGLPFALDAKRWTHWLATERRWLQAEKTRVFRDLFSDDFGDVRRAMSEIRRHPLAREELSVSLAVLLRDELPAVRLLACDTARELGDVRLVTHLVEHLEDESPAVADAALAAARGLTGFDLPANVEAWYDELDRLGG